jgi:hypothetical protein
LIAFSKQKNTLIVSNIRMDRVEMRWGDVDSIGLAQDRDRWRDLFFLFFLFNYCIFIIYSRYLKRVTSKRDGCEYLKQVPSIDGSLELI